MISKYRSNYRDSKSLLCIYNIKEILRIFSIENREKKMNEFLSFCYTRYSLFQQKKYALVIKIKILKARGKYGKFCGIFFFLKTFFQYSLHFCDVHYYVIKNLWKVYFLLVSVKYDLIKKLGLFKNVIFQNVKIRSVENNFQQKYTYIYLPWNKWDLFVNL